MTLFDYYLQYMTELFEGKRQPPEGITLHAAEEGERMKELSGQLAEMGMPAFVKACAAQDQTVLPDELFENSDDPLSGFPSFFSDAMQKEAAPTAEPSASEPDPDQGKHAFEVFLDCIALDDGLVQYLIEVLKNRDWKEFYKLSQITTKLDLDPQEFLYWLGHREDYASDEERACASSMDRCMERLFHEQKLEILAALLSGDQKTFEVFRCEASELIHLPDATYDWYSRNYLDRDYPIRMLMKCNGVVFPKSEEFSHDHS